MRIIGFVPLGAVVVATAVGAALGIAQSNDRPPWERDRSDLPIGTPGALQSLNTELGCTTAMESGVVDYVPDPGDLPPPDEAAITWAAYVTGTTPEVTADWSYEWRDVTRTSAAMFVYDGAGDEATDVAPRTILYFEMIDDQWRVAGSDSCAF